MRRRRAERRPARSALAGTQPESRGPGELRVSCPRRLAWRVRQAGIEATGCLAISHRLCDPNLGSEVTEERELLDLPEVVRRRPVPAGSVVHVRFCVLVQLLEEDQTVRRRLG